MRGLSMLLQPKLLAIAGCTLFLLYQALLLKKLDSSSILMPSYISLETLSISPRRHEDATRRMRYPEWKQLAIDLAKLPPKLIIKELETRDPFGVRTFEKALMERETAKGATLTMEEISNLFSCPSDRISLPDLREHSKAQAFRSNVAGTFLFFQHLSKAGGTNFCTLARDNLPKNSVGHYFCMSDYDWWKEKNETGAGKLHHWSNEEISTRMKKAGHRVTGNEFDNFDRLNHFDLDGAIFATSLRAPMDRALSSFRFNCIEDRGCEIKDVGEWWKICKSCYNAYTRTFADVMPPSEFVKMWKGNSTANKEKGAQLLEDAIDTVAKFHLVLSMEWLAYAQPQVKAVLGFNNTSALTRRVRPHVTGARKRDDGQEENKLGAAGIHKASWAPKEYLTPEQYQDLAEHLALDEILTDFARRLFLERLVCTDLKS